MRRSAAPLLTLAMTALAGAARAQPATPPDPGSYAFHLDGYAQFVMANFGSSLNRVTTAGGADNISPFVVTPELHLRPHFDGQTLGGLRYGAAAEVLSPWTAEGGGNTGKFGASDTGLRVLDVNRAYGYLGQSGYGVLRVGRTDSAFTLLQTGVIEAFGDGGQWTLQGGAASRLPRNAAPVATIVYADQPALYSTFKLVYLSPSWAGLKFAAGFEPGARGIQQGYSPNGTGYPGELPAQPQAGDLTYQRENTLDAAIEYEQTAFAVEYKLAAAILYGTPGPYERAMAALAHGVDALRVYQFGAEAAYAGLTLGANLKTGRVKDGYALQPRGARNALSYSVGASYQLGPAVLGASYFNSQSAGAWLDSGPPVARSLSEYGVAAGGNYVLSQHLNLFLQYMYGHRHQPGNISLIAGNAQVQVIALGATLAW